MKKMPIVSLFATLVFFSSHPAEAQKSAKVARIGFLTPESRTSGRFEAFRQGLRDLGYVEGKNIVVEYRGSEDGSRRVELATELVREKVDVIVTQGRATFSPRTPPVACPLFSASAAIRSRPAL